MREAVANGTARRADLPSWSVAGKTGTSQDFRDAWFIGFTSQLVAGVWLGNDDNTPMNKVTGGSLPAPVWKTFMLAATQGMPVRPLPSAPVQTVASGSGMTLDRLFGQLAPPSGVLPVGTVVRPPDYRPPDH